MTNGPNFYSAAHLPVSRAAMLLCTFSLLLGNATWGEDTKSRDQLVESVHQRIRDLNLRMRAMGASDLPTVNTPNESPSFSEKNDFEEIEPKASKLNKNSKKKTSSLKKSSFEPNTGFYFLPFGGLAMVDDFDLGVNTSIESKKGYSLGASFGYRWKYFYLEERISYAQAQLERFHNAGTSTSVSGEISNLSFQQAIGLNFNFNEWSGVQIGLGGGITKSELSYSAGVMSYEEDDWVFSYDGTIGIFFQPSGYFRGGINYRWLRTEDMDQFSGTDMHLIELALGLQF
jgi:hypothetical protein